MNKFDETYFKILYEIKSLYDDSIFVGDNMIFLWNMFHLKTKYL